MLLRILDRWLMRLAGSDDQDLLTRDPNPLNRMRITARIAMRYFWVYIILFAVVGVVTISSGMDVYHRTEVPEFCNACHEMGNNFATWQESRHGGVECIQCHAKPGFLGFVEAKMGGTRQLATHFTAESIEDISMDTEHKKIVSDNCQRCHPGAVRLSERNSLAINHQGHMDKGAMCTDCHNRRFVHPGTEEIRVGLLADTTACFRCHDGKTALGQVTPFAWSDEASCQKCHLDSEGSLTHGLWKGPWLTCGMCHKAEEGATHFGRATSIDQRGICGTCHQMGKKEGLASTHVPTQLGACHYCHEVMSPAHIYRLGQEPENALCLDCHTAIKDAVADASKPTPFAHGAVDLHNRHGMYLSGKKDWCMTCHNPHGSDTGKVLVDLPKGSDPEVPPTYEQTESGGRCAGTCHDDRSYDRGGEPAQ